MNAEDTKKAMKCCMKTFPLCHGCPLKGTCITEQRKPLKKALELIEHYEAEIERLTVNMNAFGLGMMREKERADTAKSEATKEFAERLNAHFSDMENQLPSDRKIIRINEVKSLMDWILHDITKQVIAEVVKEMTGETQPDTDFPKDYSYGY